MKKLALAMACVLAVGIAQADDKGGFSQDAAPPPPHKLDDGYRGVEDGRIKLIFEHESPESLESLETKQHIRVIRVQ